MLRPAFPGTALVAHRLIVILRASDEDARRTSTNVYLNDPICNKGPRYALPSRSPAAHTVISRAATRLFLRTPFSRTLPETCAGSRREKSLFPRPNRNFRTALRISLPTPAPADRVGRSSFVLRVCRIALVAHRPIVILEGIRRGCPKDLNQCVSQNHPI